MDGNQRCVCAKVDRASLVALAIRAHGIIGSELGQDLFSVPAWDMLLDLYKSSEPKAVSLTSLSQVPATPWRTAMRIIHKMVERDLLVTAPDPQDGRRIFVALSPRATELLDRYFNTLLDLFEATHNEHGGCHVDTSASQTGG